MNTEIVRQQFLDFFKSKGHVVIQSASLLPKNDPSTLFTGSGMQPLVPYLLGEKHPSGTRLANFQKCFRSQDFEEVGDNRHTTFFEMLGNWSLGDYYKESQIEWIFVFLIQIIGLDPNKLYVTVYQGNKKIGVPQDNESVNLWKKMFNVVGIQAKIVNSPEKKGLQGGRIFYYDESKNWWSRSGSPDKMPIGEPGGPNSEMFWDFGEHLKLHENSPYCDKPCHVNCDCGRFLEIGNNVFMEYVKTKHGYELLPDRNVDFGGGLERIAAARRDNPDVFLDDVLFTPMRRKIEELSGKRYEGNNKATKAFRVIMDHLRGATFLISDGAIPSNKEQGYFTRRLIRRAIRFAYKIGVDENFTKDIAETVIQTYANHYSNLTENRRIILNAVDKEENQFRATLKQGLKRFEQIASSDISGWDAFDLYQTFGFPIEMTCELARERGLSVDKEGYTQESIKHQELSRSTASAGKFKGGLADTSEKTKRLHTAAHLMLAALQKVLGDHVNQKGSNITIERLRFDFSHSGKLSDNQKQEVERLVNEAIKDDLLVTFEELTLEEAKGRGAVGVFDSKYGEKVKVYKIGEGDNIFSYEICGGPHVERTGILGGFKIQSEKSSSAGVRRIKAVLIREHSKA
ncbi:MAG: Alanine--tRNA ligase [Syntrophomonadaceae bacterium]|nr:Alanine--tRNA ligase [Bacillota bacterium]